MREEDRKSLETMRVLRETLLNETPKTRLLMAQVMGFGTETWLHFGPFDFSVHTLNVSHDQTARWFGDLEAMVEHYEQTIRTGMA